MEINKYSELLFNYFSENLSEEEKQSLLKWLKESREHQRILSEMSDWWAIAHVPLFKSALEEDFKKHFSQIISHPVNDKSRKTGFLLNKWMSAAAVLLLLISVGVSSYFMGRSEMKNENTSMIEAYTLYGMQSKVLLPDSSVVMLNSGSVLRYMSDFNSTNRIVELEGEAFFEVKPDMEKPFFVNSGQLSVCVRGTSFNVKAYNNEETIDVVLLTGKVDVRFDDLLKEDIQLIPNQQLSYSKTAHESAVSVVDASDAILWTKGILHFTEKAFPEIAGMLERKYAITIDIHSPVIKNEVFSGSFSSRYSLDEIMNEIDMDGKYRWYYEENKLIIEDR